MTTIRINEELFDSDCWSIATSKYFRKVPFIFFLQFFFDPFYKLMVTFELISLQLDEFINSLTLLGTFPDISVSSKRFLFLAGLTSSIASPQEEVKSNWNYYICVFLALGICLSPMWAWCQNVVTVCMHPRKQAYKQWAWNKNPNP